MGPATIIILVFYLPSPPLLHGDFTLGGGGTFTGLLLAFLLALGVLIDLYWRFYWQMCNTAC